MRFCRLITTLLSDPNLANKNIVYVCSSHNHRRSNSIYLICAYCVIVKNMTYKEAYQPFFGLTPPPAPFRDAGKKLSRSEADRKNENTNKTSLATLITAFSVCPYPLPVTSAIRGVSKAIELGHFVYETFDVDQYDEMDKLENGDCTWIVKGKLMAFSGPQTNRKEISPGVYTKSIEEFPALFKKYGVTGVIRFNKKLYDRQVLIRGGINHYDLYYEDGGNPTEEIAQKFLKICEEERGGVAVHCKVRNRGAVTRSESTKLTKLVLILGWAWTHGDQHRQLHDQALRIHDGRDDRVVQDLQAWICRWTAAAVLRGLRAQAVATRGGFQEEGEGSSGERGEGGRYEGGGYAGKAGVGDERESGEGRDEGGGV